MAKEQILDGSINRPFKGLYTQASPIDQPEGSSPFVLNSVPRTDEGDENFNITEKGNTPAGTLPQGMIPNGKCYTNDGRTILTLVSFDEQYSEIGIVDKYSKYTTYVRSTALNFKLNKQINITYRLVRGCEDTIYFTDANSQMRSFNFSKPQNYYTNEFKRHLKNNDASTFNGEKWNPKQFSLFPSYKVPCFATAEILTGGAVIPGTYNFGIQLMDENLNPTNNVYTSQLVSIYRGDSNAPYNDILGSSYSLSDDLAGIPATNKSIKLTINSLDNSYAFYRILVAEATSGTGEITRVVASPPIPIERNTFIYDGNISGYTILPVEELQLSKPDIDVVNHVEQIENRLILTGIKGKQVNYCSFQKFASKIASNYVIKETVANDATLSGNPKSPNTYFDSQGYMGDEVYAMGIIYIFDDGFESPVFHIPGRPVGKYFNHNDKSVNNTNNNEGDVVAQWSPDVQPFFPNAQAYNSLPTSQKLKRFKLNDTSIRYSTSNSESWGAMAYHENSNSFYEDKDDCQDMDGYWGVDFSGSSLIGKNIRHHKFPSRTKESHIRNGQSFTGITGLYLDIALIDSKEFPSSPQVVTVQYEVNGTPYEKQIEITKEELPIVRQLFDEVEDDINSVDIISVTGLDETIFTYTANVDLKSNQFVDGTILRNLGIQFSNIEYPHPDIVGHYFVRAKRDEQNRTILDKGLAGKMYDRKIKDISYTSFATFTNYLNNSGQDNWLFTPKFLFQKQALAGDYLRLENQLTLQSKYVGSKEFDGAGGFIKEVNTAIEYRVQNYAGTNETEGGKLFKIEKNLILDPANKDFKFNGPQNPVYNLSWTNRLHVTKLARTLPKGAEGSQSQDWLNYVSVKVNRDVYPSLDNIKYQRTHNCMLTKNNTNKVFGGDTFITNLNLSNSYYRDKRKGVASAILAGVLIVGAAIATIATAGLAAPALASAIGVAAAIAVAEAVVVTAVVAAAVGLTSTVVQAIMADFEDGNVDELTFDRAFADASGRGIRLSSVAYYANEHLSGVYVESEINTALRQEENHVCGQFYHYQMSVLDYFKNRWLYYNEEKNKWAPKGIPCPEIYHYNKDYSRQNEQSQYFSLPSTYDCCSDCLESHPNRTHYSEPSYQEERTDNFRIFKPNNYRDLEGEHGTVTNVIKRGNNLFYFTEEAMWILPQGTQERVSGEIVTFIGTGEFFAVPPKKIIDNEIGTAGTRHKWGTINVNEGLLFITELEGRIYLWDKSFNVVSDAGLSNWFRNNLTDYLAKQFNNEYDVEFPNTDNPANPHGVGIHSTFDSKYNRVLITKRDYLIRPEFVDNLSIVTSVNNLMPQGITGLAFDVTTNKFVFITSPMIYAFVDLENGDYFINKSWTISLDLKALASKEVLPWKSFHSYKPNFYIHTHEQLLSTIANSNILWKHNAGNYLSFYGVQYPFIVEAVFTKNGGVITNDTYDISFQTLSFKDNIEQRHTTFNKLIAYNTYQSTGILTLVNSDEKVDEDFMFLQDLVDNQIVLHRKERDYHVNDLRNYISEYNVPMFTNKWDSIRNQYYIDKVVNPAAIDVNKPWYELENLKDKYLIVRFIFDNFTDRSLVVHYIMDTTAISTR